MTTATICGIVGVGILLASLAEHVRFAERRELIVKYMSRRSWLRVWDIVDGTGMELTEVEFWLRQLDVKGKVVKSKRGTYWRWKCSS